MCAFSAAALHASHGDGYTTEVSICTQQHDVRHAFCIAPTI